MRHTYGVEVDCANCARKIEEALNRLEFIEKATLIYVDRRLILDISKENEANYAELEAKVLEVATSVEHGFKMMAYDNGIESEEEGDSRIKVRIAVGFLFVIFGLIIEYVLSDIEETLGKNILVAVFFIGLLVVGYDVIANAFRNLVSARFLDENFLMTVATVGALVVSFIGEESYWTEAVAVMLFYQIGEYFEGRAMAKTRKSVKALVNLKAPYAVVVREEGILRVRTDDVEVGETVIVKPGEMVPIDGTIVSGESFVDTKAMTGEPVPRHVAKGDEVLSGYINTESALKIVTLRPFEDSASSKVLKLIEESAERKSSSEKFITKFARYYTPAVVLCALAIAIVPSVLWPDNWADYVIKGLIFLVVSCPCALVVSVPLSYFCGIGHASKNGILIKGSNYIEAVSKIQAAVFDKTGTLTKGEFAVNKIEPEGMTQEDLMELVASAEAFSNHPIARSICAYTKHTHPKEDCKSLSVSGKGVTTEVCGKVVSVGNLSLMSDLGIAGICASDEPGTHIYVAVDGTYAGHILISDSLKDDSEQAVSELRSEGVSSYMLTGDSKAVGESMARKLQLDGCETELLPADKISKLEGIMDRTDGQVAFIGDGINDAPSLRRADVGIAMGGLGSDAAVEAADVVIVDDKPSKVVSAIRISRRTQKIVVQNILLVLVIKFLILALTVTTDYVNMWIAIIGDVGVLILAVLNAVRALGASRKSDAHSEVAEVVTD